MRNEIKIVEVGPRDGLQSEVNWVETADKLTLIEKLAAAGAQHIEASSFVSPRWTPQMQDHETIAAQLQDAPFHASFLVPNQHGFERACRAGVKHIAVLTAASAAFLTHNLNCTYEESLARCHQIVTQAKAQGLFVRGYVSCIATCPFDGPIAPTQVIDTVNALHRMGCDEISLGDTTGQAHPKQVTALLKALASVVPVQHLAVHFHNTYGLAIANIAASLACGIRTIDSAVAGLGGCPYAPGASGNVATEDVLYFLSSEGYQHGFNLEQVIATGQWICELLNITPRSYLAHVAKNQ